MAVRIADIKRVLECTERDLLNLLAKAAANADYDTLDAAHSAAQSTRALLDQFRGRVAPGRSRADASQRQAKRTRRAHTIRGKYPKFSVRNGSLVKTAWSKKRGKEYTHRLPRATYELVIEVIMTVASMDPAPRTVEQMLKEAEKRGTDSVPNYHVYTALACFCSAGLAEKVGREGYVFVEDLPLKARQLWEQLAAPSPK